MKKSIAVLLALVLVMGAVFFGCGKKEDETPDDTTETTVAPNQQAANDLESNLGQQALVVLSNEFLEKGAAGNTLDTAAARITVKNASQKTVTYAVVAFGLWGSDNKPIVVSTSSTGNVEFITRYSFMGINVADGGSFGGDNLIPVTAELSSAVAYINAIPVSCTFSDGTNWVNPCYEEFMTIYDGQDYVEADKNDQTSEDTQENITTAPSADDNGSQNNTAENNQNSNSQNNGGSQDNNNVNTPDNNTQNNVENTPDNNQSNNGNTQENNNNQDNNTPDNNGDVQNNGNNQENADQGTVKEEYLVNKCVDIFSKGTYKMTVVSDPGTADEAAFTMAVKNGNMLMRTDMDDFSATMLYDAAKDTTYMLLDDLKMYTDVTEDMMGGDMDMSELTKEFNLNIPDKVTVSTAQFNGKTARCESIVEKGIQSNYYFDAEGNLIGREDFNDGGTVSTMLISDFGDNVDDSAFEIPSGYIYVPLSWIMKLMG